MSDEIDDRITDPVAQLRDEMNAQFNELKASFDATLKEKDAEIAKLTEQNTGLQRALVRSAQMDPPKQEVTKTEDEIYQERVKAQAERTIEIMKSRI